MPGVKISSLCLPTLFGTPGSCPPWGPPSVHSFILLPNNDSYRQNSALHIFTLVWACFKIGVFKLQSSKKIYTFLSNINPGPFDPYALKVDYHNSFVNLHNKPRYQVVLQNFRTNNKCFGCSKPSYRVRLDFYFGVSLKNIEAIFIDI